MYYTILYYVTVGSQVTAEVIRIRSVGQRQGILRYTILYYTIVYIHYTYIYVVRSLSDTMQLLPFYIITQTYSYTSTHKIHI